MFVVQLELAVVTLSPRPMGLHHKPERVYDFLFLIPYFFFIVPAKDGELRFQMG